MHSWRVDKKSDIIVDKQPQLFMNDQLLHFFSQFVFKVSLTFRAEDLKYPL